MSQKDKRSRLEKLLCILEESNQDQTLRLAAQKIADVALQQPHHIPSVLRQVHKKLYSKEWKARVYAGDVLADLAQRVEHCTVDCLNASQQDGKHTDACSALQCFSLNAVLLTGETLVSGTQGSEPVALSFHEVKAQLGRIKARFGLNARCNTAQRGDTSTCEAPGSPVPASAMAQTNSPVGDSPDMRAGKRKRCDTEKEDSPIVADQTAAAANNGIAQSARERNKIKRQVKGFEKQASGMLDIKCSSVTPQAAAETDPTAAEDEQESERIANGGWPFQRVADQLVANLLDANWQVRHGAAVGLRQLLREQAGCAAVEVPIADPLTGWRRRGGSGPMDRSEMTQEQRATAAAANNLWLQDAMAVLLVLLVLDRFADYHNDSATAPVRETAAQALAFAAAASPQPVRQQLLEQLINLQLCHIWEVRHGSMMCIKCIMAVDTVAAGAMVHRILPVLMQGMRDHDDDVRASAVQACVPLATSLVQQAPHLVPDLIACLWELLPSFDVVSPAPASVLQLLGIVTAHCMEMVSSNCTLDAPTMKTEGKDGAESDQTTICRDAAPVHSADVPLCTEAKIEIKTEIDILSIQQGMYYAQSFIEHMPLLWPFFDHNSTQVRSACINCCTRVWKALLSLPESTDQYSSVLQTMLRLTYQVFVVASDPELYSSSEELLLLVLKHTPRQALSEALDAATLYALMELPSTPMGAPLPTVRLLRFPTCGSTDSQKDALENLGGICNFRFGEQNEEDSENAAVERRVACARIVGLAASATASTDKDAEVSKVEELTAQNFRNLIATYLCSTFGLQRSFGALVMRSWLQLHADPMSAIPDSLSSALFKALEESPALVLQDVVGSMQTMHACLGQILEEFAAAGSPLQLPPEVTLQSVTTAYATDILNNLQMYGDIAIGQREACRLAIDQAETINSVTRMRLAAVVAAACVACRQLPDKISSVIQPLMAGLRKMPEKSLRKQVIAAALAEVVTICIDYKPSAVDKVLSHLRSFACNVITEQSLPILSKKNLSTASLSSGSSIPALPAAESFVHPGPVCVDSHETLAREGAEATLQHVVSNLGVQLLERLPQLWDMVTTPIMKLAEDCSTSGSQLGQLTVSEKPVAALTIGERPSGELVETGSNTSGRASLEQMAAESMQLLQCVAPSMHVQVHEHLASLVTQMMQCMVHVPADFRSAVCGGMVRLTAAQPSVHLDAVITALLPCLEASASLQQRSAGIMLLAELLADEGPLMEPLLPYAALLTVPTLALMTDPHTEIRTTAAAAFGRLMSILPIAMNQPLPELSTLDATLREKRKSDLRFLEQLLDSQSVTSFDPPVQPHGVTLRGYQREGVSWLAFLQKCGLHGVLADDMGLGKTVQTLTIIACSMATSQAVSGALEPANSNRQSQLPSLIICPATLLGHWVQETKRYFGHIGLPTIRYQGTAEQRQALQKQVRGGVLVVASYESVRSDAAWFASKHFQYCALDEGHIIRNSKAKVTKACKQINANHRLVLSGTPVQNSVTELWSLFDFLMPGYLGTETEFNSKYRSAVSMPKRTAARNSHLKSHLGALDSLHKQVLPFVLRRTKEQVLNDLPPKIIQDIVCELTPLQQRLYEVAMSGTSTDAIKAVSAVEGQPAQGAATAPVFHVLQRLRKLCSHPRLMLDMNDDGHVDALRSSFPGLDVSNHEAVDTHLRTIEQAPKLMAFRQLLSTARIITSPCGSAVNGDIGDAIAGDTGQHRVLCFAQMKATLDLVESVVLDPDGVSYLRLDGDVSPARRSEVVQQFNTDPTVDVMLLTTAAGCHGLNLTTANVVVFLEHDWNPMKDMQAMDRAHRLGQKRTVTVYRLLTEGTLEEHIMSLQQFKVNVANTVVSADNVAMDTMDTSSVLDLMGGSAGQHKDKDGNKEGGGVPTGKTGSQITSQPGKQDGFEKEYNDFSIEQFMNDANSIRPKRKI